jgi:hypothetical protein
MSATIGDTLSGVAYWILAVYYLKISTNIPKIIAELHDQIKSYRCILWIGIIFNIIFPVSEGIGYVI